MSGLRVEVAQVDADLSAGELADVDAGNADGGGIVGTVVAGKGAIAIVGHAEARFGEQGAGKRPVVIQAGAVDMLRSGSFECAIRGTASHGSPYRRLEGGHVLALVAVAQVVLGSDLVVDLGVVAVGVFLERKVGRRVVVGDRVK